MCACVCVSANLANMRARRDDYDTCLAETEAAHAKITESTRTLLSVAMREAAVLSKSAGMGK